LLEPSRTNLNSRSSDFNTAPWLKGSNALVNSNATTSPDGTANADRLIDNNSGGTGVVQLVQNFVNLTSGADYSVTIYLKSDQLSIVYLFLQGIDGANSLSAYINLSDGSVTNKSGTGTFTTTLQANGFYKVEVNFSMGAADTAFSFNVYPSQTAGSVSVDLDGTSSIFLFGMQIEAGSYPTSYIPTAGSTVTRNADSCSKTGISSLIGDSEGTLFFEASVFDNTETNTLRITDGTTANRVEFNFLSSSQFRLRVDVGSSVQVSTSTGTTTSNQTYKIAIKYANNDFAVWVDGIKLIADVTGTTFADGILTKIAFEGPSFYGNVKSVKYFPTALTDSELEALTQP